MAERRTPAEIKIAYQHLLSGAEGDIVKEDLLFYAQSKCHVPGDPYTSAYNEGKRMLAQFILDMVEVNTDG